MIVPAIENDRFHGTASDRVGVARRLIWLTHAVPTEAVVGGALVARRADRAVAWWRGRDRAEIRTYMQ
ncbi:hypothetical protein A5686_03915 [Mycobacterium sp. E2479]|nr:hypothetical protein A5686_03915 [Mycobacterium sp. E2479]